MMEHILHFLLVSLIMSALVIAIFALGIAVPALFTAKLRYTAWVIVLVGFIFPLRPMFGGGFIDISLPIQAPSLRQTTQLADSPMPPPQSGVQTAYPLNAQVFNATPNFSLLGGLLVVWAAVAAAVFVYHVLRYMKFVGMVLRWSIPVIDEDILDVFQKTRKQNGIRKDKIDLKICSFVSTSMLVGFFRPVILLPKKDFDADELALIFHHELVHYKRGDLFVKLLSVFAMSMHWFNPAVYLMNHAMQADCEVSCDEVVLSKSGYEYKQFYAELIMEMIGKKRRRDTLLSTCFYQSKRGLRLRMGAIMDAKKTARRPILVTAVVFVMLTISSGSVFAISLQPQTQPQAGFLISQETSSPGIGLEQARDIALGRIGGGEMRSIEAGYVDGEMLFGISILQDSFVYHITLSGADGYLISLHMNPYPLDGGSGLQTLGISLEQAIQIAYSDLAERGIAADFYTHSGIDWEYGRWVWELEFINSSGLIEYYVNINDGTIVYLRIHKN